MAELTRYLNVIRAVGAPPAPSGVNVVELALDEDDPTPSVIDALRAHGVRHTDLQHHTTVFLASGNSSRLIRRSLVQYVVLYGYTGQFIDIYADDGRQHRILHLKTLYDLAAKSVTRIKQPGPLMWAQVDGSPTEGIPTVRVDAPSRGLISPQAAMVISQAARLRMVPPASAADAFALLTIIAALRRRGEEVRFPYLSTGAEPVPVIKDDPLQGIDLEKIRREASGYREESRAGNSAVELVPREPVSALNGLVLEANGVDIRRVLERLGCSPDEIDGWQCPRPTHRHYPRPGQDRELELSRDNWVRCGRCDREPIGAVRLVVEVLKITPDEAVRFILEPEEADLTGTAVTAHVEEKQEDGYLCRVHDPVTNEPLTAFIHLDRIAKKNPRRPELAVDDRIVALVTRMHRESSGPVQLELSPDTEELVERLLCGFVPELLSGEVVVKKIARVAGATTKIAVASTARGVDAVGAFVGKEGSRIKGAQRALNRSAFDHEREEGEKLQIVPFSSRRATFLAGSVQPAKAVRSKIDGDAAVVAISNFTLDGAIGRGGLNAELAGKLTGLQVKMVSADADLDAELRKLKAERAAKRRSRGQRSNRYPDPS